MSRLNEIALSDTFLKELSELHAVSGNEGAVRRFIREKVTPLCDEVFTDTMGNLYAHRKKEGAPVIALTAHMDEVGMMIRKIRDDGELEYDWAGLDPRVMPGRRVAVGKDVAMRIRMDSEEGRP